MQRLMPKDAYSVDESIRLPNVLGHEIADIMERMIIRLQYPPGAHLTEQEICERFNISRSPVREAFRQLESIGLVVRQTRRGIRVTPMTHEDVDEIYFCRTPLESIAASCATKHAKSADLAYLSDTLGTLDTALKNDDSQAFFEANVAYFDRVHSITGNHTLEKILRTIEKQAMRYRYFAHTYSRKMQQKSASHLRHVFESISAGDADEAYSRTETMMREAHKLIVAILREHADLARPEGA